MSTKSLKKRDVNEKNQEERHEEENSKQKQKTTSVVNSRRWNQLALCARNDSPLGALRPVMIALEISCHGLLWILGTITTLMCTHKAHQVEIVFNLLVGLGGDLIVVGVLKLIVQRQRPSLNKMDMIASAPMDQYSFPSGHSTRAIFLTVFFADQVFPSMLKPVLAIAMWAVLVCISRLLLGRHHLSDVLSGCAIGVVEYYALLGLWLPQYTCVSFLEPFFGHFHL